MLRRAAQPVGRLARQSSHPAQRPQATARCLLAEFAGTPIFTSSTSGVSFYMNTTPMDYTTAERMCNLNGGHLATYGRCGREGGGGRVARFALACRRRDAPG
jgi:hypothetical protein